jgi:hypothetical protein
MAFMIPRSYVILFSTVARRAALFAFVAALSACLSAAGLATRARAQAATATLSGTVVDENGAVIPGASVAVSNASTGLQRRLLTDGVGRFSFPVLPPGKYTVRVVSEGFAPVEIRDPELNVNDHLAYRIELKVGGVGTYVLVEDSIGAQGSASAADSAASVSTLIDRHLVENLPLNGQSFQSLFSLSPGSVQTRASFNEQGQFSFNGQRANANYFTVDGVSANFGVSAGAAPGQAAAGSLPALSAFGGTNGLVSAEALQEVRIQTSAYAAEFGRLPGAQVSLVTRSGTNEFHGSAFEYFRHDALSTTDWFVSSRALDKPRHRQNNFGGTLGGPLVKNRVFFFSSYEGLRLSQPVVTITEVPSLTLRQIGAAELRPLLNAFPIPNWDRLTGVGVGGFNPRASRRVLEEFAASYSDPARLDSFAVRLDANVGEQLLLFGRYSYSPSETVQRGRGYVFGTSGQSLNTLNRTSSGIETLTAGATWVASSGVANETRVSWNRAEGSTSLTLDGFGGAVPLAVEQLAPPGARPDVGLQFLILGGVSTSLGLGRGADNQQRQFNLVDNLSVAKSSHQLKFGVDYRRLSPVYRPAEYFQQVTFPAGTNPQDNPAIREGKASQVSIFADGGARFPLFTNVSAFAQDAWHPAARLTLTYGVRWELSPPPTERRGNRPLHALNFDDPSTVTLAPADAPLWKTSYLNLAPRLGVAIKPLRGSDTMIRAGVGIYYDAGGGQAAQVFGSVQPYTSVRRLEGVAYPLNAAQAAPPTQTSAPPFDIVYAFAPDLKLPYSLQWNVTIEQPLGAHQTIAASYAAAAGRRLLRQGVLLSPNQNFREVRVVTNTATSDYRALLVQYQHRLARGLQALASYTWARSFDNASGDADVNGAMGNPLLPPERTASDFDVRHSTSAALSYDVRPLEKWGVLRLLLGDMSADAIFRARTATPVSVFFGRTLLSGDSFGLVLPDVVSGQPFYVFDMTVAGRRRINRKAFAEPGSTGHPLTRNALRGFGMWQADVGLQRRFALTERVRLHLRAEVFNVFNHPSFGNPVGDLGSGLFGQSIQTLAGSLGSGGVNGGLSPSYQVGGTRSMQLGLRLQF